MSWTKKSFSFLLCQTIKDIKGMKWLSDLAKKKWSASFSFPFVVVQPLFIALYPYDFNINALLLWQKEIICAVNMRSLYSNPDIGFKVLKSIQSFSENWPQSGRWQTRRTIQSFRGTQSWNEPWIVCFLECRESGCEGGYFWSFYMSE